MARTTAREKERDANTLFKNRRFCVTTADIRTMTAYYPINETVGRIRRDILFAGLGFALFVGWGLWLYRDLWRPDEMIVMGIIITLALLIGTQISILELDARAFPQRRFIAHSSTVRKVFDAIVEARAIAARGGAGFEPESDEDSHDD